MWPPEGEKFENRTAAGRALGGAVAAHLERRISGYADVYAPLVLALPRGGVPVGYEVAKALNADFDLVITQKIGLPWQTSFGVGAMAEDGPPVFVREEWGSVGHNVADRAHAVRRGRA